MRRGLQSLRSRVPERAGREDACAVHRARHRLRPDLRSSCFGHGARKRKLQGLLRTVRKDLRPVRPGMRTPRDEPLQGVRASLPPLRGSVPPNVRNGLNEGPAMNRIRISAIAFSFATASFGLAPAAFAQQQMDHSNMPGMNMPGNAGQPSRTPSNGAAASPQSSTQAAATGGNAGGGNNTATSTKSPSRDRKVASNSKAQPRAARPDRN